MFSIRLYFGMSLLFRNLQVWVFFFGIFLKILLIKTYFIIFCFSPSTRGSAPELI